VAGKAKGEKAVASRKAVSRASDAGSGGVSARPRKSATAIPKARREIPPPKSKTAAGAGAAPRRSRVWSEDVAAIAWDYVERHDKKPYEDLIPTVTGLAAYLRCSVQSLYRWSAQPVNDDGEQIEHTDPHKASLQDALGVLMSVQGKKLIEGGVRGLLSGPITKLMLTTNHGMADRSEVSGPDGGPLRTQTTLITPDTTPEQAAAIYRAMLTGSAP